MNAKGESISYEIEGFFDENDTVNLENKDIYVDLV